MSTDLEWYGYQHVDGSVHLKRHTPGDDPVARDLAGNDFVAAIVPPFSAPDRETAARIFAERLSQQTPFDEILQTMDRNGMIDDEMRAFLKGLGN
jgi:hypothetical protein